MWLTITQNILEMLRELLIAQGWATAADIAAVAAALEVAHGQVFDRFVPKLFIQTIARVP